LLGIEVNAGNGNKIYLGKYLLLLAKQMIYGFAFGKVKMENMEIFRKGVNYIKVITVHKIKFPNTLIKTKRTISSTLKKI